MTSIKLFLMCVMLMAVTRGFPNYAFLIPNGNKVLHLGVSWPGVGHNNQLGGGPLNPFGIDFRNNNNEWNETLCRKDSDLDGRTNGEELGDPNCTWKVGQPNPNGTVTHPGIKDTGVVRH